MLQIIGTKSSKEYRKAVRFCKERRIPFQEVDTEKYTLSSRELDSILSSLEKEEDIIDREGEYYRKNGYSWREYDVREEISLHPSLMVNPILRNKNKAHAGFLETFILENRE